MNATSAAENLKPYEYVGAGPLISPVWKHGDTRTGWQYRFHVLRKEPGSVVASPLLSPADLPSLVNLSRVLAAVLADDGCMPQDQRRALAELAVRLEPITARSL